MGVHKNAKLEITVYRSLTIAARLPSYVGDPPRPPPPTTPEVTRPPLRGGYPQTTAQRVSASQNDRILKKFQPRFVYFSKKLPAVAMILFYRLKRLLYYSY